MTTDAGNRSGGSLRHRQVQVWLSSQKSRQATRTNASPIQNPSNARVAGPWGLERVRFPLPAQGGDESRCLCTKGWKMKRVLKYAAGMALVFGLVFGLGHIGIARSSAQTPGCETVGWGINLFGNWTQRRSICDGPRQADGTWLRARAIWTPAHYVPVSCYSGRYYGSCSGGYFVEETVQAKETYITSDTTLPPNEPGWLPPATEIVRA